MGLLFHFSQGICPGGNPESLIVNMGVDFRRVQVLMPQHLLNGLHIDAILKHKGSGGVAELMGGIFAAVQPGLAEMLFHKGVDIGAADPESPQTVMQLVAKLGETVGWAKSTTITTLRRMEEKGLVQCEIIGKGKSYTPAVEQEKAVVAETRSFLDRVYRGSVGLMMSAMAQRQELTKEEIQELRDILAKAEEERK